MKAPTLLVAPYGEPARRALKATIDAAKAGDPLVAVSVVVPSALAGMTLRRRLAADGVGTASGLVAVGFLALPELAERLASPLLATAGRRPIADLEAFAVAARILAENGGPLAASATHPATVDACLATFADLRGLTASELAAVAGRSERAGAVVAAFRAFRHATKDRADAHDVLVTATEAVRHRGPLVEELGTVAVYLPRRLSRAELALLEALADIDRLVAIVGRTSPTGADEPADAIIRDLEAIGLRRPVATPRPPDPEPKHASGDTSFVRAPDPAEEARAAVREVVAAIRAGIPPERIAVVSRIAHPYTLLAHEELAAAGIAHSAPSATRLSQSRAGRTLLDLLAWPGTGYRRDELMRMLRAAPVRGANPHRWDRIARRAGVVAGLDQWRTRLATYRVAAEERDDAEERTAAIDQLLAFVERLASDLDPPGGAHLAAWAKRLLMTYLGGDVTAASWPDDEQRSRAAVLELLDQLAALDGHPDPATFRRLLAHHLDRPAGRVGRFGHGVFVGRLVDVVGADLDRLIVLGAGEGTFPPAPDEDALLPSHERAAAGRALRLRGQTRAEEERDIRAALASSPRRTITFPVADTRAQRARQPSPWVLARCSERLGRAVTTETIAELGRDSAAAGWFRDIASFEWWLGSGHEPATATELDVRSLLAAHRAAADPDPLLDLPTVNATGIRRGLEAASARANGEFGPWTGAVGAWPELADDLAHPRSPTSLQDWAVCPFRYFVGRVLGVRPLDDPADVETIAATDRGSLVHEVLERFIARRLDRPPGQKWDDGDRSALLATADEVEAEYRGAGRTGRPLLWGAEWDALRRHLLAILDADENDPRLAGVSPVAVELGFGEDGNGTGEESDGAEGDGADSVPVVVDLPSGRTVRFHGRIDRVDRSPDGRRLVVLDYKTGGARDYNTLDPRRSDYDIVARGTLLQLPIYALAASEVYPGAEEIEAYYWFVGPRGAIEMRGGPIDDAADERFRSVLATIAEGIEGGVFPARPGDDAWYPGVGPTHANCRYCAFDRVCSAGRGEQWVELRRHPKLAAYVELAEPEPESSTP